MALDYIDTQYSNSDNRPMVVDNRNWRCLQFGCLKWPLNDDADAPPAAAAAATATTSNVNCNMETMMILVILVKIIKKKKQ